MTDSGATVVLVPLNVTTSPSGEADISKYLGNVRYFVNSRKNLLLLSFLACPVK